MAKARKIVTTVISLAVVAAVGVTGFMLWRKKDSAAKKGTVYVQAVSDLNTAEGLSLSGSRFSGVVETQKTEDVKYDTNKNIAKFYVKVGDKVKEGDKLFAYDIEAMQLQYDQAKIELERMKNEVETNKLEIEQLEKEKKTAKQDDQVELTMRILSLQSDVAKAEYDIKTKRQANKKLKESLKNADVYSPIDGIVKSLLDVEGNSYNPDDEDGGGSSNNVAVSLSKGDDLQIRASVNEQMINMVYAEMPVILRSRIDSNITWSGTVSGIETKPQTSSEDNMDNMNDEGMEEDASTTTSKYSFYVLPESFDGLMLGQHLIVEPDMGIAESDIEKKGIWLYSDFVVKEDGKTFVWAANDKNRIEKREVKLGKKDEENGDVEILEGLTKKDFIAYPDEQYEEGMKVTKDYDKSTFKSDDEKGGNGEDGVDVDDLDDEFIDEDYDDEDYDNEDFDDEDEDIIEEDDEDFEPAADVIGEDD